MPVRVVRSFFGAVLFSLTTTLAFAHAVPKVMLPAANATVSAPAQVSVVFSEAVEAKFSSLKLTTAEGAAVGKAESVVDAKNAKHMTLALPALTPGVYVVHWVSMADDGHKASGEYKFTVR